MRATAISPEEAPASVPGKIEFSGGLILSSPERRFGGWSGLELAADGRTLVAVSDTGGWLRLIPDLDAGGQLIGVHGGRICPMLGTKGAPITGNAADAESLRRAPTGGWLVSFESQHRLWHYPDTDDLGQAVPTPVAIPKDVAPVDGIQHLVPTFDGGDDFVWIGGPGEGSWGGVGLDEEAVDGGLEVDDGAEDTALQAPFGEFGEEALHGVEPRA